MHELSEAKPSSGRIGNCSYIPGLQSHATIPPPASPSLANTFDLDELNRSRLSFCAWSNAIDDVDIGRHS